MSLATIESSNGLAEIEPPQAESFRPPGRQGNRFTFADMQAMADAVVKGRLFPGLDTPAAALSLMLICDSEGMHPIQALKTYHIISGRPAMRADAMQASFQRHGGVIRWDRSDATECSATFFHPVHAPDGVLISWTLKRAQDAGLCNNPTWKKYPDAMLRARVISAGIRMVLPGIVAGIYTPEEVESFDDRSTGWSTPLPSKPPQNASGHGSGAYGSPAQVAAYVEWLTGYVDTVNARFVDTLANLLDRAKIDAPAGLKQVVFSRYQMSGHLLKHFAEVGTIEVDERGSANGDKPDKLMALVFDRDPDAVAAEAESYHARCWQGERTRAIGVIKAAKDATTLDAKGRGQLRTEDVDAASLDDDDALYPADPSDGT